MNGNTWPILLADLMGKELEQKEKDKQAACIRGCCAWWNDKYGMCYIEMIMMRA
jgi:hypothetical protein